MRKLRFVLFVVFVAAIGLAALPASADMGSSTASVDVLTVDAGDTLDVTFTVNVVTPDLEWMERFDVTFPANWAINSLVPNAGPVCGQDGVESTLGQTAIWEDPTPTECGPWGPNGSSHDFTVNVTVGGCAGAPWDLPWNAIGDGFGPAPSNAAGTFQIACTRPAAAAEEEVVVVPVPGCDALITMPSNAVGATITADTPVYWTPGSMSDETFPADLHLLALGVDESGAYTKVLYVCGTYWVPTSVIGPNYDAPWNGAPLPVDVVD